MFGNPVRRLALAALIAFPLRWASPAAAQEVYVELKPADTAVDFTLGAALHTVHGTFKLKRGEIHFDPATRKASGAVVVDAASGHSGNGGRDRRMHENVLETGRYPDIVFTPDRVDGTLAAQGTSQLQVHGMFRIHGVEHELTLPVQVEAAPGEVVATAHFEVPYVKWGMKNPSTLFLRVSDKVAITIHTVTHLSPTGGGGTPSG